MHSAENPFAGQGPVLLDIGGDVGALVVAMPAETEGLEVEIRPLGSTSATDHHGPDHHHDHEHHHGPDHHDDHDHHHQTHVAAPAHGAAQGHPHPQAHHPHVGVVARPGVDGPAYSLVYPEVTQGWYELVPIPGETVVMTAEVEGGRVTHTSWPTNPARV